MDNWWDRNILDPENYGKNVNFYGKKTVALLIEDAPTVLDAGCGNGLVYKATQERGLKFERYKGVDLSENFIKHNKEHYPEVEWEVQDITDLKESDESFDTVILMHVLECCEDFRKPIKDALRIAKRQVIVGFWKGLTPYNALQKGTEKGEYQSVFSEHDFFPFLRELGFDYFPWVEKIAEDGRYNLIITLPKHSINGLIGSIGL